MGYIQGGVTLVRVAAEGSGNQFGFAKLIASKGNYVPLHEKIRQAPILILAIGQRTLEDEGESLGL
jgi:hypothetical protein